MLKISIREINQNFSRYLQAADSGEDCYYPNGETHRQTGCQRGVKMPYKRATGRPPAHARENAPGLPAGRKAGNAGRDL